MSGSSPLEKRGQTFFFFKAVGKLPCGMIYQPLLRKYRLKVAIVPPLPSLKFLGRVGSPTFRPNFAPFHPLGFAVFFFFFKSQETQLRCFFDNSYQYSTFKMWLKISVFKS